MKKIIDTFLKDLQGCKAKNKSLDDILEDIQGLKSWLDASIYFDNLKLKNDKYKVQFEIDNNIYNKVHIVKIKFGAIDLENKNKTLKRYIEF